MKYCTFTFTGLIIDPNVMYANLNRLKETAKSRPTDPSIAALSTLERNRWAGLRDELLAAGVSSC